MKSISKLTAAGLLLAAQSVSAVEPAEGWYAGFLAGVNWSPDTTYHLRSPFTFPFGLTVPVRAYYNVLADAALQLGFRCANFRYEGELTYNSAPYRKLRLNGIRLERRRDPAILSMKGYTSTLAGFFNLYYDFFDPEYAGTKWVPYAGLGIGYANIRNSVNFYFLNTEITGSKRRLNENKTIGQAILGLSYYFSDAVSVGTDLRYMTTGTVDALDSRVSNVNLNFVMNFAFDQPGY